MENTRPKIANDHQRKQHIGERTTKTKRAPHEYFRMYWHVLAARIAGEPPTFRGKPRFCEKNTVKRRKGRTMERKQVNGKRLGSRIALRLKFPAYYPPLGAAAAGIQLPIQRVRAHTSGGTFYAVMSPCEKFPDPSLPFGTTIRFSGSSQGAAQASHTWMWTIVATSLFNIVFQTCSLAFSQDSCPYFWESLF